MLDHNAKCYGSKREVPTLVLAGASLDDVFAITLFGAALTLLEGGDFFLLHIVGLIPLQIVLGILSGLICGQL